MWSPVTWEIGLGHCQMAAGKKHWRLTLESWGKGARGSVLFLHPGKPHLLRIVIQMLSSGLLFATPWTAICQASPSFAISLSLLKLMSIESVMPSNYLILCGPFSFLSSVFPSIRVFSNESPLYIRWPKYWSFSFTTCPSNEYSGLISFRIGWFDHLVVKGTLKTLLQHHNLKAFFGAQPSLWSNSHICTGKTIPLTIWTFVGKVMSLLFKMVCRFVIAFLLKSKHLLISWLQSLSSVIFEDQENVTVFHFFPRLFAMKWWDWMPWS